MLAWSQTSEDNQVNKDFAELNFYMETSLGEGTHLPFDLKQTSIPK